MLRIDCPWCEADGPLDAELLAATGGRFTCPDCLTSVELVMEPASETMALAA